jgi:large subunit ribosomal protein L21e
MQRSRGFRSKSRRKMTKVAREGRSNPITNKLQRFEEGDLVHITINPSIQKGQPHPRFHGKTGKITDKKGKAYIVSLTDGNKAKELIIRPDHLKLQTNQ